MDTASQYRRTADRLRAEAGTALRAAMEAEERAAQLESVEEPPIGSIVTWDARYSDGQLYTYAAIRSPNGRWYTTGPVESSRNPGGRAWRYFLPWVLESLEGDLVAIFPNAPTRRLDGEVRSTQAVVSR